MKGSYNAVTQSASGEYGREDYQESRKNTAMSGGVIIAVIAVVAVVAWLFWDRLNAQVAAITNGLNPFKAASDAAAGLVNGAGAMINHKQADAVQAAVYGGNSGTPTVSEARDNLSEYYPVKTLTSMDYNRMLQGAGDVPAAIVSAGNVITPNEWLSAASGAGSNAADTVNRLGLNNAYCELPDWQRGLVTLGEGVGSIFGVDLIQQGANNAAAANNLRMIDTTPPTGDNLRSNLVVSLSSPTNGQQNLDAPTDWATYYAGMT
jgi:hypothetical protein